MSGRSSGRGGAQWTVIENPEKSGEGHKRQLGGLVIVCSWQVSCSGARGMVQSTGDVN